MPRLKRGGRRGNFSTLSRSPRHGGLETSLDPFRGISTIQTVHHGFTLQEEARNTGRQSLVWNSDQRLRDSKVNFISAGTLDPKEPEVSGPNNREAAMAEMSLESPTPEILAESNWSVEAWEPAPSISPPMCNGQQSDVFVFDTHRSQPIPTGLPQPQIRPASPTPSNSSDEIILFRGKNRPPRSISKQPKQAKPKSPHIGRIDTRIKVIDDQIHDQKELLEELQHCSISPQRQVVELSQRQPQYSGPASHTIHVHKDASEGRPKRRGKGKQCRHNNRRAIEQQEEEAIVADYVANLAHAEDDEDEAKEEGNQYRFPFRLRELGGTEGEIYQEQAETSSGEPITDTVETSGWNTEWNNEDFRDFDGISPSDSKTADVENILSKREKSGLQYLVYYRGQSKSEAKWAKVTSLTDSNALKKIAEFEAEETLMANITRAADRMEDSTESSDEDVDDSLDDHFDDDDDLIQRKKERMSDEQIARLLAKQDELGMGSNELLLFDAEGDEEEEYIGFAHTKVRTKATKQSQGPGAKRPRGDFPAVSALQDAYVIFDPMDRSRSNLSLKKRIKGRKGKLPFDISDSEFEASMQHAWDYDRVKKSKRKKEREKLRAQGLLGSKNGKVDLKAKYKEGMDMEAVKEEIKKFLMGINTTLPLTPMSKADRKIVHEYANAFNLKSKSVGSGNNRFPILYRTQRTSVYTEGKFAVIEARIARRFMPRIDVAGRKYGAVRPHKAGFGFGNSSASHRDGDIVGASAPELGVENRGRAMLEKMGWSTGTALGALNNKGILQPVSHVVKTTKAGLG